MFNKDGDYRQELNDTIDRLYGDLVDDDVMLPVEERLVKVEEITDAYVSETGERPTPSQLDRLASYILKKDQAGAKWSEHKDEEYPYLSDRQYAARLARETSLQGADSYDSSGINQNTQTRSKRIQDELLRRKVK